MERSFGYRFCTMIGADCSELGSDEGDGGDGSGLEGHGTGDLEVSSGLTFLVWYAGSPGVGLGDSGFTVAFIVAQESLDLEVLGGALDGHGHTRFGVAAIIVELVQIS